MSNKNGHLISWELLREADYLRSIYGSWIKIHPPITKERQKSLNEEALRHSVSLELEGLKGRERKREERESGKHLQDAYRNAIRNYNGLLTEDFIVDAAKGIEPGVNEWGYRHDNVRILGGSIPPSSEKIEREMEEFLFENNSLENPLEKALHAHLNIARIHPFGDGNGRVARLVQNVMLENQKYLPIVIRFSERSEYLDRIGDAISAYSNAKARLEDSPEIAEFKTLIHKPNIRVYEGLRCKELALSLLYQKTPEKVLDFYNYLAEKELVHLREEKDKLMTEIRCQRIHSVSRKENVGVVEKV